MTSEDRFVFVRELGRGAMGTVDLVMDVAHGAEVARKRPILVDAATMRRFKREFRTVERLSHPNIVRVYELGEDDVGPYFTMQYVEGEPLDAHARGRDLSDVIAEVLPALLDALRYIHREGIVHRDLKPTNLLVQSDGVLKVLDFGVLGAAGGEGENPAGTLSYMAPEQLRGDPAGPEVDCYALGAVLFQLAMSAPPFVGTRAEVRAAHLFRSPPPVRGAPPGVDAICRRLLAKIPSERATLDDVEQALLRRRSVAVPAPLRRRTASLVGRDEIVASALSALDRDRKIAIVGPSGVGKSTIAATTADRIRARGGAVLGGRVRLAERVPFNALDAAIDELVRVLAARSDAREELRRHARVARALFPALALIGVPNDAHCKELVRFRLFGHARPPSCADASEALGALLECAARDSLLVVDDFQWADDDSLRLLATLFDAGISPCAIALVVRDDVGRTRATEWLDERPAFTRIEVPPLAHEALLRIACDAAHDAGAVDVDRSALSAVVGDLRGLPLLAEVAGRALAPSTGHAIAELVGRRLLGRTEIDDTTATTAAGAGLDRRIVALLVAADDWMTTTVLARCTRQTVLAIEEMVGPLERAGILRRARDAHGADIVDLYHDLVRRASGSVLADELRAAHAILADDPDVAPEERARHLLAAGRLVDAADAARGAATLAEAKRAFGLAADMYAIVLRTLPDDRSVRRARAVALERTGRYADAAAEWQTLAQTASGDDALELGIAASTSLVAAGRAADGLDRLDETLRRAGELPVQSRTTRAKLEAATVLLGPRAGRARRWLARLGPQRVERAADPERDVRLAILLAFVDPASGVRYFGRIRDRFAAAGDDAKVAECDYLVAVLVLVGSRAPAPRLAAAYLASARARAARRVPTELVSGMDDFVIGLTAMRKGELARARLAFDAARTALEAAGAVVQELLATSWRTMCDVYAQDVARLRVGVVRLRERLGELGGGLVVSHVDLTEGYLRLLEGDLDATERFVLRRFTTFVGGRRNAQRAAASLYRHLPDIYRDRAGAAEHFRRALVEARGYRFLHTMYAGPFASIGALLEANALRRGERDASARKVERFAAVLDASPPLAAGTSNRARAYAFDAMDRPEEALRALERAESDATRYGRTLDASIARYQWGLRMRGDTGREACERAKRCVREAGASEKLLDEDAGLR